MQFEYDDDCHFCARVIRALERHESLVGVEFKPLPHNDRSSVRFTHGLQEFRGYEAFRELFLRCPISRLRWLFRLPGADLVGPRIYRAIARRRNHLARGSRCGLKTN